MIIEFSVQNFRSFRERQTLSMVASNYDKSLPDNLIKPSLPNLDDLSLIKAAAIYGPNAGGKTNLLLALRFLRWLVVESATGQKPEAKLPIEPFRLDHESFETPTTFELTFVAEGIRYELAVVVDRKRVVQERLVAYPQGKAQLWYDRVWNEESGKHIWLPEKPTGFERDQGIIEKTRENALFLSTAAQWNNAQVKPIYQWFSSKLILVNLSAEYPVSHDFSAEHISQSAEIRELFVNVMRSADLGLSELEVTEEVPNEEAKHYLGAMRDFANRTGVSEDLFPKRFWQVVFQHEGKGGETFPVDWSDESAGTRRFFSLLGPWYSLAANDLVLCVDEFETSLHPSLAIELLRMLFKLTGQEKKAQFLFTTHNPLLLDQTVLRRDQIWFADKNREGESFLYPLTDYKPRTDESLVRGYLSGRYGAVPFIPHGLMGKEENSVDSKEVVNGG